MFRPPSWLTRQSVDQINADEYAKAHQEFLHAFEAEELRLAEERSENSPRSENSRSENSPRSENSRSEYSPRSLLSTETLKHNFESGSFWYSLALDSPTGLFRIFYDHIQPRYSRNHFGDAHFFGIMKDYWSTDADCFLARKVLDKEKYDVELQKEFQASAEL
ncbi:hypothetical protein DV735_g4142, partial [Chaetothyriales sp. CBS 134920]